MEKKAETTVLEITGDKTTLKMILHQMIEAMKGPDGRCKSAEMTLAMRKLQEAHFWVGQAQVVEGE